MRGGNSAIVIQSWRNTAHLLCSLADGGGTSYVTCANVQMRGGTQYSYNICYTACADERWNTVQYSFVVQLVQVEHSTTFLFLAAYAVASYPGPYADA